MEKWRNMDDLGNLNISDFYAAAQTKSKMMTFGKFYLISGNKNVLNSPHILDEKLFTEQQEKPLQSKKLSKRDLVNDFAQIVLDAQNAVAEIVDGSEALRLSAEISYGNDLSRLFATLGTKALAGEMKIRSAPFDVFSSMRQKLPQVNESLPQFFSYPDPWKPGLENLLYGLLKLEEYSDVPPAGLNLNPLKALQDFIEKIKKDGNSQPPPWDISSVPRPQISEKDIADLTAHERVTAWDVLVPGMRAVAHHSTHFYGH
jgi:hypothetical protein